MPVPPPCTALGRQCRELDVTLRIADMTDDSPTLRDAAATWLLGHTERITFGRPYVEGDTVLVDATIHVGCKFLRDGTGAGGAGAASESAGKERRTGERQDGAAAAHEVRCAAYGYAGSLPGPRRAAGQRPPVRRGRSDLFTVFFRGKQRWLELPLTRAAQRAQVRALPVLNGNPCAGAPCRTADNARGAACCRDLTLEVAAPAGDQETEAFLRSRRSPYLCKVERQDDTIIECEVISACAYLDPEDGISCTLHDRLLPNNQLAKPSICREWPGLDDEEVAHPGCRLV